MPLHVHKPFVFRVNQLCMNVTVWNIDQNKTMILFIFLLALFWLSFVFIDCQTLNDNLVCCTPQASFPLFHYSVLAPICLQKKVWHSATETQNHSESHGSILICNSELRQSYLLSSNSTKRIPQIYTSEKILTDITQHVYQITQTTMSVCWNNQRKNIS